jgi:dipeptidase E
MRLILASLELQPVRRFIPTGARIGFVPTAGDVYADPSFVGRDRKLLTDWGYTLKELPLKEMQPGQLASAMRDLEAVFVAGGNSFYLLQQARRTRFTDLLADLVPKGLVYIGASAGAVLVGPSLEPIASLDDPSKAPDLDNVDGVGLVDFVVLPHYGSDASLPLYRSILDRWSHEFKLRTLQNDQLLLVEDGRVSMLTGPDWALADDRH